MNPESAPPLSNSRILRGSLARHTSRAGRSERLLSNVKEVSSASEAPGKFGLTSQESSQGHRFPGIGLPAFTRWVSSTTSPVSTRVCQDTARTGTSQKPSRGAEANTALRKFARSPALPRSFSLRNVWLKNALKMSELWLVGPWLGRISVSHEWGVC